MNVEHPIVKEHEAWCALVNSERWELKCDCKSDAALLSEGAHDFGGIRMTITRDFFSWTETEYEIAPAFINVTKDSATIRLAIRSSDGEGYAEIYLPFNEARQLIDFLMIAIGTI